MLPQSIIRQGAAVAYGWLHYHATQAARLSLTFGQWTYPLGWGPAVEHPTALRLRALAERLFRLRNQVGRYLTLHGRRYTPWEGV
jgi:hypothetical protein